MRMPNDRFRGKKGKFLFALFFPLLWALLIAIVMWLWNAILPSLLHIGTVTYWQAAGLFLLCRILFGGFQFRPRGDFRQRFDERNERWNDMREKWKTMSDEDRKQFKMKMRDRWCQPPQREEKPENRSDDKEEG